MALMAHTTTVPSRSASRRSTAVSALSNNPPYLVSVNATLLCPAHSKTSRTLQPAATMIATKKSCAEVREGDVVQPGAQRVPQDSASPPNGGAGHLPGGEHKSVCSRVDKLREVLLTPHEHERATGTERFERVVLGSLSKVTRPRNWTAVDITRMRGP